jgi:hypothetical protein
MPLPVHDEQPGKERQLPAWRFPASIGSHVLRVPLAPNLWGSTRFKRVSGQDGIRRGHQVRRVRHVELDEVFPGLLDALTTRQAQRTP